ncbi:sensor histidine kinase [Blautia sp. LMAG:75]|uniref:sensor histidine kinase n=1 Tax=Blautia sp. LMAG:75 TaxID=1969171 RepID=UPI0025B90B36|nr:hypothetical protein [Blautia sp. LMAG:75]
MSKATNVADCVNCPGQSSAAPVQKYKDHLASSGRTELPEKLPVYYELPETGTPIDFSSEIDPSILPCLMPKFILQPLLENAISHQNPSPEVKNTITLTGYREDNIIYLVLKDNGLGIALTDSGPPGTSGLQ